MRKLFKESLTVMETAFRRLEEQLKPPVKVPCKDGFVFRFEEKGIKQALLQKLARSISGLHAIVVLLDGGFLQEQGVIARTLGDVHEDILFLTAALTIDSPTKLHNEFLAEFYADPQLENTENTLRIAKPSTVKRKKIRAYNTRLTPDINSSKLIDGGESINTTYSGFVHASSYCIMEMYGGDPAQFHLHGLLKSPYLLDHTEDSWNYFYRGLCSTILISQAYGDIELYGELKQYIINFEKTEPHPNK